jgi:hypothetical protein
MVVDVRVQHWLENAERRADSRGGSNNLAKNMWERSREAFRGVCSSKIEISDSCFCEHELV